MTYRAELLQLAEDSGAIITGKPDGSEPITIVFSVKSWRNFDIALQGAEPGIEAKVCGYTPGESLVEFRLPAGWRQKGLALELGDTAFISAAPAADDPNTGHGHVFKRPDDVLMRCGGPAICKECARDAARKAQQDADKAGYTGGPTSTGGMDPR